MACAQHKERLAMPLSPRVKKWLIAACVCACLGGVLHLGYDYARKTRNSEYGLTRFLATYHTAGNQYLIPPEQTRIRLEAGVPVYATWKSHPTKDSEFLEWYKRVEAARKIYDGGPGAQDALQALLASHAVTHVVWPEAKGTFPFSQLGRRVFGDKNFSLWDMR